MLTIYPFTWTGESLYERPGYRVAGWPLNYWQAIQTQPTSAPWYWTDPNVWRSLSFSPTAFVCDVSLTLFAWFVILPPKQVSQRSLRKTHAILRWMLGTAFASCVMWNVLVSTKTRDGQLAGMKAVKVNQYAKDDDFPLFQRVAHECDTWWRGEFGRLQRGAPVDVTIQGASEEEVEAALRILPKLKHLTLINCDLSSERVTDLALNENFEYFKFDTANSKEFGITESSRTGRLHAYDTNDLVELSGCYGEIDIPNNVNQLRLVIPAACESTFQLTGMKNLSSLEVNQASSDSQETACRLKIGDSPSLTRIHLSTIPKFAIKIDHAPQLRDVYGFSERSQVEAIRMTELDLSGPNELDVLSLDLSHLKQLRMDAMPGTMHVKHLILFVDSTLSRTESSAILTNNSQQFAKTLSAFGSTDYLELNGLALNHDMLLKVPFVGRALTICRCSFAKDVGQRSFARIRSIVDLEVDNLSSTADQLAELQHCALNSLIIKGEDVFHLDAALTLALPSVVFMDEYHSSVYFKLWQRLSERTQIADSTGVLGTFDLRVTDPQNINSEMQQIIDEARRSGLIVQINSKGPNHP